MDNNFFNIDNTLSSNLQSWYKFTHQEEFGYQCPKCKHYSNEINFHETKFLAKFRCGHYKSYIVDTIFKNSKLSVYELDLLYSLCTGEFGTDMSSRAIHSRIKTISHVAISQNRNKIFGLAKDWHANFKFIGDIQLDEIFVGTPSKYKKTLNQVIVNAISRKINELSPEQVSLFTEKDKLKLINEVLSYPVLWIWRPKNIKGSNTQGKKSKSNGKPPKAITAYNYLYLFRRWRHYKNKNLNIPKARNTLPDKKRFVLTMTNQDSRLCKATVFENNVRSISDINKNFRAEFHDFVCTFLANVQPNYIFTDGQPFYRKIINDKGWANRHFWVSHKNKEYTTYIEIDGAIIQKGVQKTEGFNSKLKNTLKKYSRLGDKVFQSYLDFFCFRYSFPNMYKKGLFFKIVNPHS